MIITHVFVCPFTGKTPAGDMMTQEWFDKRAALFEKYTIPSLAQQTNQDFYLWITFRPEDASNPTTNRILEAAKGLRHIATFDGTMFREDRATWHNADLEKRLRKCLPSIEVFLGQTDYIYETNLDSDDTIHRTFSNTIIHKEPIYRGALYCKNGYAYNTQDRLAQWNNPISNQNYTIGFPAEMYFDAGKRLHYLIGFQTHEEVPIKFVAEQMPDGMYCTIIHGDNISTVWDHPFRGEEIYSEDEKKKILTNFF